MLYVSRNSKGQITGVFPKPYAKAQEALPEDHPDIVHFFSREQVSAQDTSNKGTTAESSKQASHHEELAASDREMIRVLEDVIEILVKKNIITFTELPQQAQQKIINRKQIRKQLGALLDIDNPLDKF